MKLDNLVKAQRLSLKLVVGIFVSVWLWLFLTSNFPIKTRGSVGEISVVLDGLYVVVLPLLGIATILMACVAIVKRSALMSGAITIIVVSAILAFWAWSLSPSGQSFNLSWRK